MKQLLLLILPFALLVSCFNNDDYEAEQEEQRKQILAQYTADSLLIESYLTENKITATLHASGIFYKIEEQGSYPVPNLYSAITVNYKGYLLNGTVFDQTETDKTATFYLASLISGWQVGVPLIGSGGKITLFLPSYFGYRNTQTEKIPANSVLIFEIELLTFK